MKPSVAGPSVAKLNADLLKKQNVSEESELLLEELYESLSHILAYPEEYEDPVKLIEGLELKLQFLWGFPQDTRYHRYWKYIKGCTCPKVDNEDPMYFGRRITVGDCKWHWRK